MCEVVEEYDLFLFRIMPPRKRKSVPAVPLEAGAPNQKKRRVGRPAGKKQSARPVEPAPVGGSQPGPEIRSTPQPIPGTSAEQSSPMTLRDGRNCENSGRSRQRRDTATSANTSSREEDTVEEREFEVLLSSQEREFLNSPPFVSSSQPISSTERLTDAIVETLRAVKEASLGEGNSRLLNRLTTARKLPKFSGNPMEWLNFKEAYLSSSELGAFSDRENVARLFEALEGEARASVSALLATASDATAIMRTLELQFGNKHTIAERIIQEIKGLPDLGCGSQNIACFAAKLRNSVTAFKSIDFIGYLHSPELAKIVANKLPSALRYAFNRYAAESGAEKTMLEKLADFIYKEAELAVNTSIFDVEPASTSAARNLNAPKRQPRSKPAIAYTATHIPNSSRKEPSDSGDRMSTTNKCAFCERKNHRSWECRNFARETIARRWVLVKKNRLCFKCLDRGHVNERCRGPNCSLCKKPHHSLLHKSKGASANTVAARQGSSSSEIQAATLTNSGTA